MRYLFILLVLAVLGSALFIGCRSGQETKGGPRKIGTQEEQLKLLGDPYLALYCSKDVFTVIEIYKAPYLEDRTAKVLQKSNGLILRAKVEHGRACQTGDVVKIWIVSWKSSGESKIDEDDNNKNDHCWYYLIKFDETLRP